MLNSYAGGPEDSVLFDNAEVFSMFDKNPPVAPHLRGALEKWTAARKNEKKAPKPDNHR